MQEGPVVAVPTTVPELIETLDPMFLVDRRTIVNPPARPSTVWRRAMRNLPDRLASILRFYDADRVTAPAQVGAFAALIVACNESPDPGDRTEWLARMAQLSRQTLPRDLELAPRLLGALLDSIFETATDQLQSRLDDDNLTDLALPLELIRCEWVHAVREGYAPATFAAAFNANLLSTTFAERSDLAAGCEAAVTAARWAAAATDGVEELTVLFLDDAVRALQMVGRDEEAIELARDEDVVRRHDALELRGCMGRITLRHTLARANRSIGADDEAVRWAEEALWEAETEFGPAHELTIDALCLLGSLRFGNGDHAGALEIAAYAHEIVQDEATRRPAQAANAALGLALCLHANGITDRSQEVARAAAERAQITLGANHEQTQALWRLANH